MYRHCEERCPDFENGMNHSCDEAIPYYVAWTKYKAVGLLRSITHPTLPLAMTDKSCRHCEERWSYVISCTNCSRDEAIPYYVAQTKHKAVGLLHSMTHPTLPPAYRRQARKLYFVEIT